MPLDLGKYKTQAPTTSAPSKPVINFAAYKTNSAPSVTAPKPKQTVGQMIGGAAKSFSTGVAKGELATVQDLGQTILKGADALGFTKNKGDSTFFSDPTALDAKNVPERVGKFAETAAEVAVPVGEGAAVVKNSAPVAKYIGERATSKVIDAVMPKLTAKEAASNIAAQGTKKSGLFGKVTAIPSEYIKNVAAAVEKHVPDFNPSKTFSENVNATRKAAYGLADKLKQEVVSKGQDIIYPFRELASRMSEVEKPIAIKSDAILERQFDLAKQAALKIAKEKGGKISNLLDARKEFDALVEKQFPNLYDRANAPMRDAITSMRGVMNDFIATKLPDVAFKDSLSTQSKLFTAIDNLSEKAASEINTNAIERAGKLIKDHPVASLFGGVGAYEAAKKIPVVGGLLP